MKFVVVQLASGTKVQWQSARLADRQVWLAEIAINKIGPDHLVKALTPEEHSVFSQQSIQIVAVGTYPPHLVGRRFYTFFKKQFYNPVQTLSLSDKKTGLPILMVEGTELVNPATAGAFRKWSSEDRQDFLENPDTRYSNLKISRLGSSDPIYQRIESEFKKKVSGYDVEVDNGIVKVGSPKIVVELVKHVDGSILGGNISVRQDGAQYPENNYNGRPANFNSIKEAKMSGAELGDVNWTAFGIFEIQQSGKIVWRSSSSGMEWSGY
ncbi:MAG: hypothetical protein LW875_10010 [Proteobacteria bacterium]|jgi:hypothetical protein|nr:hypothetical protein [Pseudomonadota bacterium]